MREHITESRVILMMLIIASGFDRWLFDMGPLFWIFVAAYLASIVAPIFMKKRVHDD